MKTARTNLIILNVRCEFVYSGENVWVPMGRCGASDLSEMMDDLCGNEVVFTFTSSERHEAADKAKFSKRLALVNGWEFSEWSSPIRYGHKLSAVWQCVAKRSEQSEPTILESLRKRKSAKAEALKKAEASSGSGHDVRKLVRLSEEIEDLDGKISAIVKGNEVFATAEWQKERGLI